MIGRLYGSVVDQGLGVAILDVHGVGYEVFAPQKTLDAWAASDEPVVAHIHTQVREDALTLYGFEDAVTRDGFRAMLKVSGIGPKLALAAINALGLEELARAVDAEDLTSLSRIPGVGKKSGQRLLVDLKGKLKVGFEPTAPGRTKPAKQTDDLLALALARLDYGRSDIQRARAALEDAGLGSDSPLEERIRHALRVLSGSS